MSRLGCEDVDHRHRQQDQHQNGGHIRVVELADGLDEILADAARADEAHDGRLAHVDLETQQGVAGEVRHDLRQRAETHGDMPGRAGRRHALDRLHVDILDDLGEQFGEHAECVDDDRQHARHRAEPEGNDEDQRQHQGRHGAASLAEAAHDDAQPARRRHIGSRQESQDKGHGGAQHGADIGHEQGFTEQPQPALQAPEPLTEVGPDRLTVLEKEQPDDVARETMDVFRELGERDFSRDRGQQHRHRDTRQDQQRVPATAADRGVVCRQQRLELRLG